MALNPLRWPGLLRASLRHYDYPVQAAGYTYIGQNLLRVIGPTSLPNLVFDGMVFNSWVSLGAQYWLQDPAEYLMVVSTGNYPLIAGSTLQKRPMTQAVGSLGEGISYPITQLCWRGLFSNFIDPIFLANGAVLGVGVPAGRIRTAFASSPNFILRPMTVISHRKSPDFVLTNGFLRVFVESKSSTISAIPPIEVFGRVEQGAAQLLARVGWEKFGIVVVSAHSITGPLVHVGVVALA